MTSLVNQTVDVFGGISSRAMTICGGEMLASVKWSNSPAQLTNPKGVFVAFVIAGMQGRHGGRQPRRPRRKAVTRR